VYIRLLLMKAHLS